VVAECADLVLQLLSTRVSQLAGKIEIQLQVCCLPSQVRGSEADPAALARMDFHRRY
jgi:hypothetical protein